jgi:hypothetical protein
LFGGQGFGTGVYPIHADVNVSFGADGSLDFSLPLAALEAPLDGDVVSVTAMLANGQPLPSWLHFDAESGKFAGLVPDDLTGSIAPDGGTTGDHHHSGAMSGALTIEVIARDSKGDISIIDFTINLKPGSHHTWNLPGLQNVAPLPAETQHRHALSAPHRDLVLPVDYAAGHGRTLHTDRGDASYGPAGRAGLSAQLDGLGWRGMQADRMALLDSLRHAAAG